MALLIYAIGFALHPTRVLLVDDEAAYVRQAAAFARGELGVPSLDADTGEKVRIPPSSYPIGTSLLQVPFVWLGGWRLAPWASFLALAVLVGATAALLRQERRTPGFALLVLGFPAALVLGRLGMSDVPNAAVCALGLWLFFRGIDGHWGHWLASGAVAGASMLFRDTNPLFFAPLFAGTIVRGERKALVLVLGGLAGISLRVITSLLLYGEPWVVRWIPSFRSETLLENAVYYALTLSLFVPAGLPCVPFYRGRRRPEVVATVALVLVFFSAYEYAGAESGSVKQLILGPRYFLPLLPLLSLCVADVWSQLERRRHPRMLYLAGALAIAWGAGALIAILAVHPVLSTWGRRQEAVRTAIYAVTSESSLIVSDSRATEKSINELYGERLVVNRRSTSPSRALELRHLAPEMFLVFLQRSDSEFWRASARADRDFVDEVERRCELVPLLDQSYTATDRLIAWKVGRCDGDR